MEDHDNNEYFIGGDEADCKIIIDKIRDADMTEKKHTMIFLKLHATESNYEVDIYTMTTTNTKAIVFQIVQYYVS